MNRLSAKEVGARVAARTAEAAFVAALMPIIFTVGVVGCGAVAACSAGGLIIKGGREIKRQVIG